MPQKSETTQVRSGSIETVPAGRSYLPTDVRFTPRATASLRTREMSRRARSVPNISIESVLLKNHVIPAMAGRPVKRKTASVIPVRRQVPRIA